MSILAGTALPSETEAGSFGIGSFGNGSFGMGICPAPTDPTLLLRAPQARLSGCTAVNYLCLVLISCLQPVMVTAWEPLPTGFVPLPSLPSSQPEHFILVTVPQARPRRTFEIKRCMKYSGEKREEKGAISAPQACESRAFVMLLNIFVFFSRPQIMSLAVQGNLSL